MIVKRELAAWHESLGLSLGTIVLDESAYAAMARLTDNNPVFAKYAAQRLLAGFEAKPAVVTGENVERAGITLAEFDRFCDSQVCLCADTSYSSSMNSFRPGRYSQQPHERRPSDFD
jgi:hypothetical protein